MVNEAPVLDEIELLESLPALQSTLFDLRSLLHSPYPPRSIFIHATSNLPLLRNIIRACLPTNSSSTLAKGKSKSLPHIQELLPRACIIDCAELASQKALFGRILNELSGWGTGQWSDALGGVLNWDGRQDSWNIKKRKRSDEDPRASSYSVCWDYEGAATSTSSTKGLLGDRKDESLSSFLDGLKCLYKLGESTAEQDAAPIPRFMILQHAERIPGLESLPVGQSEGVLLAVLMRVGELTGKPIVPVLVSSTEWLLLRPNKGATEPAACLEIPPFGRKDIVQYVVGTLTASTACTSDDLNKEETAALCTSLADLVHQTYEPYLGDEAVDYLWLTEKCWPGWIAKVVSGEVEYNDVNRLVAFYKPRLAQEIEQLSELRPILKQVNPVSDGLASRGRVAFEEEMRLQKYKTVKDSAPSFYSTPVTPSKRPLQSTSASQQLPISLSIIAKYLLISAYLASSNPARKDILMVATEENELLASLRKKRKGGATRKSPIKGGAAAASKKESVPQRSLGPRPFPLERMLAICECILPVELRGLARSPDILKEVAMLTKIRLLVKTSGSGSTAQYSSTGVSVSAFDKLDGLKLKCNNLELDMVEALGKSVGFRVSERLWEAMP